MGPARVLLVDDDLLFIRRIQRVLADEIDLQVATNSVDALTTAVGWTPDVVVIDPLVGDADPFGLFDRLRASWIGAGVGFICLSQGPGALTRYQPAAEGFFGTVHRDAGPDGVRDALRYALAGSCGQPTG